MNQRCVVFASLVLGVLGCGTASTKTPTETQIVTGKVTLDGQPLDTGSVLLESTDKSVATMVPIGKGGAFTAKTLEGQGLPVGEYRVAVSSIKVGETDEAKLGGAGSETLPARYQSVNTSGLKMFVTAENKSPVLLDLVSRP